MAILILTFAILSIPIDVLLLPLVLWLAVPTAVLLTGLVIVRGLMPAPRASITDDQMLDPPASLARFLKVR